MAAGPWDGRYLSVATVKRDGMSTACPVWCAWDGDRLVFRTFAGTVKASRLRRNQRVAVAPCDRQGQPLAAYRDGIAVLVSGGQARRAHRQLTRRQGVAKPLAELLYRPRLGRRVVFAVALDVPLTSPAGPSVLVSR